MLKHNKIMQQFLAEHGIRAVPKYIYTGSLKGSWRLYGKKPGTRRERFDDYQRWTPELVERLTQLGFRGLHGPLDEYSGNGGVFSVFVRHNGDFGQ